MVVRLAVGVVVVDNDVFVLWWCGWLLVLSLVVMILRCIYAAFASVVVSASAGFSLLHVKSVPR